MITYDTIFKIKEGWGKTTLSYHDLPHPILIARSKGDGQVGLISYYVLGVSILQYARGAIIFMEHNHEKSFKYETYPMYLEQLSSLKVNFHKIEIFYLEKKTMLRTNIRNNSDVSMDPFLLYFWVYQFILEILKWRVETGWRKVWIFWLVSWVNYYHTMIDLF